jgi:hypothetical protein
MDRTVTKQGQFLSPAEEDLLYTGILDAYDGKPYREGSGDWYEFGFQIGQILRNSERN